GTNRQSLLQGDRVLDSPQLRQRLLVAQRQSYGFDLRGGTMTDIGNRAVEDFAVGAIRLAQQMPRIGFAATGDVRGIDIHSGYYSSIITEYYQGIFLVYANFIVAT